MDQPPRIRPPAIIIVGTVVDAAGAPSWFQQRPLFGQRILVTRPRDQANQIAASLEEHGADVLVQPAIEIRAPADWAPVDSALGRLGEFEWLVFSSANGVRYFFQRLLQSGRDLRALTNLKLAAIGPGTTDALAEFHLRADLQPTTFRAESLADSLVQHGPRQRFLLARASRGREVLADHLRQAGALVEQIVVYHSLDVTSPDPQVAHSLSAGQIDWVTVTSSAIANSLVRMFGDSLRKTKLVTISPVTSNTLRSLGFDPLAEAEEYTMAGVVSAILKHQATTGHLPVRT
jgi:uroporphyrinogen III methyltransferase/synthase